MAGFGSFDVETRNHVEPPDKIHLYIESLLARGAGIFAIEPLMRRAFSRRALYGHRAKHT
jgi:hypothetical protein